MKAITTLAFLSLLSTTARADEADDAIMALDVSMTSRIEVGPGLHELECERALQRLRDLGVPASRTIRVDRATPFLPVGLHALPAARKACDANVHANRLAMAKDLVARAIDSGRGQDCMVRWPAIVKAAVRTRDERMDIEHEGAQISGTLEELKIKYCDGAVDHRAAKKAALEAPYRKHLKHDKATIFFDKWSRGEGIVLRGGDIKEVPAKLAKARTWFAWDFANVCTDGRTRYVVRRYDFDGAHRMTKETVKEYCGQVVYE